MPRPIRSESVARVLFFKGGPGSGNPGHRGRPGRVGGSAPDAGLHLIERSILAHAAPWRELPFSAEAWAREFPRGEVSTPIGAVKMGEAQREKLSARQRERYFGLIRPTLESPTYIVAKLEDKHRLAERVMRGEPVERAAVLQFIRAFEDKGKLHHGFMCVSVARDHLEIVISASPRKLRHLARAVKEGAILTVGSTVAGETASPGRENGLTKAVSYHHLSAYDAVSNMGFAVYAFEVFAALSGGEPLLKAGSTPAGARWITVHPNGTDTTGIPVMIQETRPGSGTYHVIGGAGGKLNYLKLYGVKSASEHRHAALERRKAHEEVRKVQIQREKAAGTYQAKQDARRQVKAQARSDERAFVRQVAEKMGWKPEETQPPQTEGLSKQAAAKVARAHHQALLKRATKAVAVQRRRLLEDADARAEALGDVPLTDDGKPETLSVADLDPVRPSRGAGFSAGWGKEAAKQGLTDTQIQQEKAAFEATLPKERQENLKKRRLTAEGVRKEIEGAVKPRATDESAPKLLEAKEAAELLRAEKRFKATKAQARSANKRIDAAPEVDPNATVLEVGQEEVPDTLREDLESDLRTLTARAFLDQVRQDVPDYEQSLAAHIEAGAMASLNGVAVAASGGGMLSRAALNTLGLAGAAQAVAARLHADLSPAEIDTLRAGLEDYHASTHVETAKAAMDHARAALEVSRGLVLDPATTGHELAQAQELNRKRIAAIDEARATLGSALGSLEMQGALINALRSKPVSRLEIPLNATPVEDAIVRARALGLGEGDYRISDTAGLRYLEIDTPGKLISPIDPAELATAREIEAIQAGKRDEDDWLPAGVANRPDLALNLPPGVVERIGEPFAPGPDIEQSLRDYVGGRTADGDAPADILADLQSDELADKGPNRAEYYAALNRLAPTADSKGKPLRAEAHAERFQQWADEYAERRFGGRIAPLHRQQIEVSDTTLDALHRALSQEPAGVSAYKPIGELTGDDQRTLREYWQTHIEAKDEAAGELRGQIGELKAREPERTTEDIFGDRQENPEWSAWSGQLQELRAELGTKGLDWDKYQTVMGGRPQAYAAVQDLIRSEVSGAFADTYNRLRPRSPLKLGRTVIRGNLEHLDAIDPELREQRLAEQRELVDRLRERSQGRYAEGSVSAKIAGAREREAAMEQAQMGFFLSEPEPEKEKPLAADQRHTLGQATERKLAELMGTVGPNFKPGHPVKLWNASMSGRHVLGQRAIKMIERGKRVALGLGVGTGKTLIGLGGFTHLHAQGKIKKGLFAVPASVQGQFGAEALRYLEPGRYRWHANPGASREERLAAYRDPDTHFAVVTHQALRDDLMHLGAERAGISPQALSSQLGLMTPRERAGWAKELMTAEGISPDYLMVDEGHNLLNRAGKQNSNMANVIDALAHNTPYYVSATADPVRNDASELHDLLRKLDPERYASRNDFLQRYGVDTPSVKQSLRREVNRYLLTGRTDPGVAVHAREVSVEPSAEQHVGLKQLDALVARARIARMKGGVDVEALRTLAPEGFKSVPKAEHEALARKLQGNLGILRDAALRKELDNRGRSAKLDATVRLASERRGTPGVIFAHNLAVVRDLTDRLKAAGHRVATLTGDMTGKERDAARLAFQPEAGEPQADILVMSDAGATGLNLQRGQWLAQYDTPLTAMVHAQRRGRIHRLGQKNPVEFLDLAANHPHEAAARRRLATKYELRDILTDPTIGQDDTGLAGYLSHARNQPQAGLF